MMHRFLYLKRASRTALFVLLMMAGMTKMMAQTPYRQYADDGVLLNFHEIDNVDFRLFLLYNLSQDDRFVMIEDDVPGVFSIVSNNEGDEIPFFDLFESFFQNAYADFSLLTKMDLFSLEPNWKSSIPPSFFVSMMMDISLRNSTNDNYLCVNSLPFYTAETMQFEAASSSQTAQGLEGASFDDGCIGNSYNPSWFHMEIADPGQFIIHIEGHDPNNYTNRDIDFCLWGPFTDPTTPCVAQLTTSKIIDCSYSSNYIEDVFLGYPENEHYHNASHGTINYHNPESGEYYILMITNYSCQPCLITFTKIEGSGPGTSGCSGQKTVTANVNSVDGGTVTGAGVYDCGSSCTLTATANEGYVFMDWTNEDGVVVSTDAIYSFDVLGNRNITANFVEDNSCYLTFNLNDSNGNGWSCNYLVLNFEDGSFQKLTVPYDMSVSSYALPIVDGSHVSLGWISGLYTEQCSFTVNYSNGNTICYGNNLNNDYGFEFDVDCVEMPGNPILFDVIAEVSPSEGGFVNGAGQYSFNDTCTLTATATGGYGFVNWTEEGVIVSTTPTYSFFVSCSRNLVANFNQYIPHWNAESYQNNMFMIGIVEIDGIEQSSSALELGAFCNGECRGTVFPIYDEGRWLYFMAIGGNNCDSISFRLYDHALQQELELYCYNALLFEENGFIGLDTLYEVLFANMFTVSAFVNPEDAGVVTGTGTYISGETVTLIASANGNSVFINWTIGDEQVSTDTIYSFIITEDITIVANFLPRYEVLALVNPMEGGSVSGAGIYENGTSCTVIATANAGYAFSNWSINGEIVSTESSYTFTVTAPISLTANFSVLCSVSAIVSPENAGVISGLGEYVFGSVVTLVANANEGFSFNNWSIDGEVVSTDPSYTFMVSESMIFTVNFDVLYSVSAMVNPEDAGMVSGLGVYFYGTEATLVATPNEGYAFNCWTLDGEVVSTEPSYTFTVTESMNFTANFDVLQLQQLTSGWNWFSTYLEITLDDLKAALLAAFPNVGSNALVIKSNSNGNTAWNPIAHRWIGGLTTMDLSQMYMVKVPANAVITLQGVPINPADHPVTIVNGNNWIAFPFRENMSVNNAFAGFPVNGDIIKSNGDGAAAFYGVMWIGGLNTLNPGKGYIYKSNAQESRTFVFGTNAAK